MHSLKRFAAVVWILVLFGSSGTLGSSISTGSHEERLAHTYRILAEVPIVDGHNDLPVTVRKYFQNELADVPLDQNVSALPVEITNNMVTQTDFVKMKAGRVGGQFWSAFVYCGMLHKNALKITIEQIDVIRRLVDRFPDILEFVTTADGILAAHSRGKIGSLIGVEGGHSMDNSLAVLRIFYNQGVRYMTLTHSCNTPWADNWKAENDRYAHRGHVMQHDGLTAWGELVVKEMNRLGMIIDVSHVARQTADDAIRVSKAPVIFSHSTARALCNDTRNVPDYILKKMPQNGGVVMVTFIPNKLNCDGPATVEHVVQHINYIRDVAGVDHVGIGGDYNGILKLPIGLEDVSTYPLIFAELLKDPKWTDEDLKKLAGLNVIRAFKEVERIRDELVNELPIEKRIPDEDMADIEACAYDWY